MELPSHHHHSLFFLGGEWGGGVPNNTQHDKDEQKDPHHGTHREPLSVTIANHVRQRARMITGQKLTQANLRIFQPTKAVAL